MYRFEYVPNKEKQTAFFLS